MNVDNQIIDIRNSISVVDNDILKLLSYRKNLVTQISELKQFHHMPIRDAEREDELLSVLISLGCELGMKKDYIEDIFNRIIKDSIETQAEQIL